MKLPPQLDKLRQWGALFDAKARRERAMMVATALVAIYGGSDLLFMQPLDARIKVVNGQILGSQEQLSKLSQQIQMMTISRSVDPNRESRERIEQLQAQLRRLDSELGALASGLVPPKEMVGALRELLSRQGKLELIRVENLGATPLIQDTPAPPEKGMGEKQPAPASTLPRVFRHALVIELDGSYADTLEFLHMAEALPWRFYWETLEYRVEKYPTARIVLRLSTLSLTEGWIGV